MATQVRAFSTSAPRRLDHVYPRHVPPPPVIQVGPTVPNRLEEAYRTTLARDLMYMTYDGTTPEDARDQQAAWTKKLARKLNPENPYSKNHASPGLRGVSALPPRATVLDPKHLLDTVPKVEKIYLHSVVQSAIYQKAKLVPIMAQLRAITGLPILKSSLSPDGGTAETFTEGHIQVMLAKNNVARKKIRVGMPIGVSAEINGPLAVEFLDTLITCVLPRMRSFQGVKLPPPRAYLWSNSAMSGSVQVNLEAEAMPLFPQTEINWDSYPGQPFGIAVRLLPLWSSLASPLTPSPVVDYPDEPARSRSYRKSSCSSQWTWSSVRPSSRHRMSNALPLLGP